MILPSSATSHGGVGGGGSVHHRGDDSPATAYLSIASAVSLTNGDDAQEHQQQQGGPASLPLFKFNGYWLAATALGVWFLGIHAPPLLRQRHFFQELDVPLALHLLGSYGVYIACMHNALLTPSCLSLWSSLRHVFVSIMTTTKTCCASTATTTTTGTGSTTTPTTAATSTARTAHIWVGRVGMILGVVSFLAGVYLVATRAWPQEDQRGFAVSITIGGLFQLYAQFIGYRGIRRYQTLTQQLAAFTHHHQQQQQDQQAHDNLVEQQQDALTQHIFGMIALFVMGCGIPAVIRVLTVVSSSGGEDDGDPGLALILVTIGLFNLFLIAYGNSLVSSTSSKMNMSSEQAKSSRSNHDDEVTEQTALS